LLHCNIPYHNNQYHQSGKSTERAWDTVDELGYIPSDYDAQLLFNDISHVLIPKRQPRTQ
jgi:hypothetical protein